MRSLKIYYNDIFVGKLYELISYFEDCKVSYSFEYDDEYCKSDNPSISLTLPKDKDYYESDILFPFFSNMYCFYDKKLFELNDFDALYDMAWKDNVDFIGAISVKKDIFY